MLKGDSMKTLTIIATSDLHGAIFPSEYHERDQISPLGLARISTAIKKYRQDGEVLLLDNGDAFQGSPLLMYYHDHPDDFPNPMAQAFNYLDYDFINLGNHDFNYGPKRLQTFIKENKAPILTHNITYRGKNLGQSQIIERMGKKIALVGVCTDYIPNWERPEHIKDMAFKDAFQAMNDEVKRLADDADYVIGMYHGGFERDLKTGEETETLTGENQGYEMSQKIDELDLLITGHQHRSIAQKLFDKTVTQTAFKGNEFAVIRLNLKTGEMDAKLEDAANYEADEELLDLFTDLEEKTQTWLDQEIGYLKDGPLLIEDEFQARFEKHPLISLINQIQMEATGAEIASNAMFNGAKGFKQSITMRDLVNTYPYPNTLVLKEIDGKTLKAMLERTAEYFTLDEDGEIKIADHYFEPKPQHYNYDMLDGIEYSIDVSKDYGERIVEMRKDGKAIQEDDVFTIAVNNYRASGGGKYEMIRDAKTLKTFQDDMVQIMMNYFKKYPKVKVQHKNNIRIIK